MICAYFFLSFLSANFSVLHFKFVQADAIGLLLPFSLFYYFKSLCNLHIFFYHGKISTNWILKKSKICCLSEFRVSSNSEILLHYFLTLKYQKQFHYLHSWVHLQNKEFLNSQPWKFF